MTQPATVVASLAGAAAADARAAAELITVTVARIRAVAEQVADLPQLQQARSSRRVAARAWSASRARCWAVCGRGWGVCSYLGAGAAGVGLRVCVGGGGLVGLVSSVRACGGGASRAAARAQRL